MVLLDIHHGKPRWSLMGNIEQSPPPVTKNGSDLQKKQKIQGEMMVK